MYKGIDHLPGFYLNKSRSFQMFSRMADILFMGKRHKISRVSKFLDPLECPEELLQGLSQMIGFHPRVHISNDDLRVILKAYPWLHKWKGSFRAINTAVRIGLVLQGKDPRVEIVVIGSDIIMYSEDVIDTTIINELFWHIAPVGYTIQFQATIYTDRGTNLEHEGLVGLATATYDYHSSLKDPDNVGAIQWFIRDFVVAAPSQGDMDGSIPFDYTTDGLSFYDTVNGVRGDEQSVVLPYDGPEFPDVGTYTNADNPALVDAGSLVVVSFVFLGGQWYRREVTLTVPPIDPEWMMGHLEIMKVREGDGTDGYNFLGTISGFEETETAIEWFIQYTVDDETIQYFEIATPFADDIPTNILILIAGQIAVGSTGTDFALVNRASDSDTFVTIRTFAGVTVDGTKT
jgi:hypothetical protein